MDRLPIRALRGNLLASGEDVWAVFRVRCHSYRAEPRRKQQQLSLGLATFARQVAADFQILRVSRRWSADEYVARLRERTSPRVRRELWDGYLDTQRDAMVGLEPWTPETFICVRLAEPALDLQARVSRLFERTPGEILRTARTWARRSPVIGDDAITARARIAEDRVCAYLDARAATETELQWLIRRAFYRSVGEPPLSSSVEISSPGWWQGQELVERSARYVRVVSDAGESWQAGLCLGEVSHATAFTRASELMFSPLEEHSFPVDVCFGARWVANEQAKRQATAQFARMSSQLEDEETSAHGAMGDSFERPELARELHGRLRDSGEPVVVGTLSMMLSAPSLVVLQDRVRALRESYPHPLYRPLGDQLEMFLQHLPAQRTRTPGYERLFTCEQVGAMVPHATHEAGSDTGLALLIGHTLHGRQPVLLDLAEGSGTDRPSLISLLGTLGAGKTQTSQLFLYQGFHRGARIVDIDPKGDHRFHLLPEVAPRVREIVLGPDPEHAGKLDPLRVAPRGERADAATTFLTDLLYEPDDLVRASIRGAVGRVLRAHGECACCMDVVEALEAGEREAERRAGYLLRQSSGMGIGALGFARRDDPLSVGSEAEQVTYLNVRALKSAHSHSVRSEMTESQRHSAALLQLVALFAMRILGDERDRLKLLAFDEASFVTEHAVGKQLLDQLSRWGRSELAVPIISTQNVRDVADYENLIGHTFLFGMKSLDDAKRALEAMDLDADGPLASALVERYRHGQCLYRDLRGRCEEIQVDLGSRRLLDLLSTRPREDVGSPERVRVVA